MVNFTDNSYILYYYFLFMATEMYIKTTASFSVFTFSAGHIHHHGRTGITEDMLLSSLSTRGYLENSGQKAK